MSRQRTFPQEKEQQKEEEQEEKQGKGEWQGSRRHRGGLGDLGTEKWKIPPKEKQPGEIYHHGKEQMQKYYNTKLIFLPKI